MTLTTITGLILKAHHTELIAQLKTLDSGEKKELSKGFITWAAPYLRYRDNGGRVASSAQLELIFATAFMCLNRTDYSKFDSLGQILDNRFLDVLLKSYCPDWFGDYLNDLVKTNALPQHFQYEEALQLAEKYHLYLSDELIASKITDAIFTRRWGKLAFAPSNLEKRKVTLEKHIWLIFHYPSAIETCDNYYRHFGTPNDKEDIWITTFRYLVSNKLISRVEVLRQSLLATVRNFNKGLSGWFIGLFEALEPTTSELMALQTELFSSLSSQHSRPVNGTLNFVKKICLESHFNLEGFLTTTNVLLSSNTKSVVLSTLWIFNKLISRKNRFSAEILLAACQAFINTDHDVQAKACDLLIRHANVLPSTLLTDQLRRYTDTLSTTSRQTLSALVSPGWESLERSRTNQPFPVMLIDATPTVPLPESVEDLLYLSSQAFENNDPLHIDLLPAGLVNMQDQLKGPALEKFEAALQRALTIVVSDFRSTTGYLDHLLATFFVDVFMLLIERFPADTVRLRSLQEKFQRSEKETEERIPGYESKIQPLLKWRTNFTDNTYLIHKGILLFAYEQIRTESRLPILSTPTHRHGYLDPVILVSRLKEFQINGCIPDNVDFQTAVSRLAPFGHAKALQDAKESLHGEILHILEFLWDEDTRPVAPFSMEAVWFMAAMRKSPEHKYAEFQNFVYSTVPSTVFTGDVHWELTAENPGSTHLGQHVNTNENGSANRHVMRVTLPSAEPIDETPFLSEHFQFDKMIPPRHQPYSLFELISLRAQWIDHQINDIERLIYLFPSNPTPLLAHVCARFLQVSLIRNDTDKRMLVTTLHALTGLTFRWCGFSHVFLATCMLTSDKTVRSIAAQIWVEGVQKEMIDSEVMGKVLGAHLTGEYAPVKRFVDVVTEQFLKISTLHNSELIKMLSALVEQLPAKPPTGTSKILQLYADLLVLSGVDYIRPNTLKNLHAWSDIPGLKKIILKIRH